MYYSFVSEKIDNLTNAENELIEYIKSHNIDIIISKREWFKMRNTMRSNRYNLISRIIHQIEKLTDKYFTS